MAKKEAQDGAAVVFDGVLAAISRQRLAPGMKLPEESIAQIFGVSRAQVRTALSRLRLRGMVQMEPNKTAQVAEPSIEEVRALFEVRFWVEPEVAADVARELTDEGLSKLKSHLDQEQTARDAGDRIEATRLSGLFHSQIAALSNNEIAKQYVNELVDRSFLAIYLYQRIGEVMCVNDDHMLLAKTFADRDAEASRIAMRAHLEHILSRLDLTGRHENSDYLGQAFRGIA